MAALNLRSQSIHFLDCESDDMLPQNLVWQKKGGGGLPQGFTTEFTGNFIRLIVSNDVDKEEDSGVYECINMETSERVSINITLGKGQTICQT